jgi:hypothetical protein
LCERKLCTFKRKIRCQKREKKRREGKRSDTKRIGANEDQEIEEEEEEEKNNRYLTPVCCISDIT